MNALPTGTVTFLFTDIQGSTDLAQKFPAKMPLLLERHNAILREAIQAHNGHVFQIVGDSFSCAFFTAADALAAAIDAQRGLQAEAWSPAPIRVRMGINTGAAEAGALDSVAGGYGGYSTLARTQRVMSLAHGGQILLSNATAELVGDTLPQGVALRDLHAHRLKGLLHPEHIWQVDALGLPHEFPSLTSLTLVPNNLPQQLTSFVGRERELAEIKQLLSVTPLLTLTGSGGTGKTRLSLQTAADVLENFSDGAWFVELAPLVEPLLVPQTVARTLGIREMPGNSASDLLLDYLQSKQLLLILDNCEHLIEACAQLADRLLRACPHLRILASSREPLGIAGEHAYRVPSLSTAELRRAVTFDVVQHNDCTRLFLERASAAQSGFRLTEKNAASIAQICLRLDGIPLAVELAAARVKALSPEQIALRLDDRFRLLTGGSRTALPRQQTLRALIDWSYELLPEPERLLLRRLSVFVGGWTYEAAEAVCAGDGIEPLDLLDLHTHLVDKSLVALEETEDGNARYSLLETIRQYAREKLLDSGEMAAVRNRHLEYVLEMAEEAWSVFADVKHAAWSKRVRAEADNVRAALDWGMEHDPEAAMCLASALSFYWTRDGYVSGEGVRWLETGLERVAALPPAEGDAARARQLHIARAQLGLSGVTTSLGDMAASRRYAETSLPTWRENGMQLEGAVALMQISISSMFLGDAPTAVADIKECIALIRSLHEPWMLAYVLGVGAMIVLMMEQDFVGARALVEESITLFRRLGDTLNAAFPLWVLGELELALGNYAPARDAFAAAFDGSLAAGNRQEANRARSGIASAEWKLGHYDAALNLFSEVMPEWYTIGNRGGIARCLECIAFIWLDRANNELARADSLQRAAQFLGAAEQLRQISNAHMSPAEQNEYHQNVALLRERMDGAELDARWAAGRAFTIEEAMEMAVENA